MGPIFDNDYVYNNAFQGLSVKLSFIQLIEMDIR